MSQSQPDPSKPPISGDERLAVLKSFGVLDTDPEAALDSLARLAAQLCDAPIALVTLVDDARQFFKAREGYDGPPNAPLDVGFCPIVVEHAAPLVIPDTHADPAHAANAAAGQGGVRFYAGVPLQTQEGQTVGTLCVLDKAPRLEGLTSVQLQTLEALAVQVISQFELRRSLALQDKLLAEQQATIRERDALTRVQAAITSSGGDLDVILQALVEAALDAVPAADAGVVELIDGDVLEYRAVTGLLVPHKGLRVPMQGSLAGHCALTKAPILVDDVLRDPRSAHDMVRRIGLRAAIFAPVARGDFVLGVVKLQSSKPGAFTQRDLQVVRLFAGATSAGLTEVRAAEAQRTIEAVAQRHRAIFDSTTEVAIVVTDRDGLVTDWNSGAERILGWSSTEMLGQTVKRIFTPEDRDGGRVDIEMRDASEKGRASDERWHLKKDGVRFWASGEMMPLRDQRDAHVGYVKVLRDRTEEHLAGRALEEAQVRLRRAQEAGGVGLFSVDMADNQLRPTPEFCRLYGLAVQDSYPAETIEGLIIPEDAYLVSTKESRARGLAIPDVEYRIRRPDTGELRWIARKGTIEHDADRGMMHFTGAARDVTDQRSARNALAISEERYRTLFDSIDQGFCVIRFFDGQHGPFGDYVHVEANAAFERHLGIPHVAGQTLRDIAPDAETEGWLELYGDVLRTGQPVRFERLFAPTGRHLELAAHRVEPASRREVAVLFTDITARKRAEADLRASEERFRTILETIEAGFAIVDVKFDADDQPVDYRFVEANPAFERQAGIDLRGKWVTDFAPDLERFWFETYGHVAKTGQPANFENYAEAFARWFDVRAVRVGNPAERKIAIFFSDVTERRAAEDRLRRSEAVARENIDRVRLALAAGAIIGTWFWDLPSDRFTVDEAFARAFGLDPALGREGIPLAQIVATVHPDDQAGLADAINDAIARGGDYAHQYRVRRHDGLYYWLEANGRVEHGPDGAPLRFPGVLIDVEERRAVEADRDRAAADLRALNDTLEQHVADRTAELMRAEEQLRQSQKMEAVGQLTGGLAHDFNNLLAGISGSLELMQIRMGQGRLGDLDRYMTVAQGAAKRAAALTHRLLAFSRRQTLDPKPTDVNRLVTDMEELIRRTIGPQVALEVVGAAGLWPTLIDPGQLENALLNLCINARDAMPDGGRITIETANKWLDRPASIQHDIPEGQYLSLCVTDTGTGMPPEVIARVFEPFFTTKPIGEGTGLGLSMIYGFARQSGGQVRIYSEVGQGTTVCLYLPRHYGESGEDAAAGALAEVARAGQGETVLIVDDEPSVRMLVTEVLEDLGYTAIEAADSIAGLKVLQSDVRIDLLVTDVGLPGGMNGRQMADAGRERRPDLKVLFITGYAENAILGNGHLTPGMQVLTKPFAMDALASRIKDLIHSR